MKTLLIGVLEYLVLLTVCLLFVYFFAGIILSDFNVFNYSAETRGIIVGIAFIVSIWLGFLYFIGIKD
jgi:hypothetical protein